VHQSGMSRERVQRDDGRITASQMGLASGGMPEEKGGEGEGVGS